MYRNSRGVTGTNDIPLGNRRKFGGPGGEEPAPPASSSSAPYGETTQFFNGRPPPPSNNNYGGSSMSSMSPPRRAPPSPMRGREPIREEPQADQPRKRRSRWGDADQKSNLPGLPTAIAGNVSAKELDNYAIHVRLDEINRKLAINDVIPPERMRSPSPTPVYDAQGRRTNTREVRYKKKLENERMALMDRAIKADPNFRPPAEYQAAKRNQRPQEKVYIPKDEFPEINFFGLLVGPRGNSLKNMENLSGAKISIRGKGSVKPGKERNDQFANDAEDELHCLVMAETQDKVDKCVALINKVIETAASTPEGQNDHKRNQLRELASLNGTLRDDENQLCQNCGEKGHRKYECPQARNYSAGIICRACGGAGHMARDCMNRGNPGGPSASAPRSQFDSEYASLMAELGEGGSGGAQGPVRGAITAGGESAPNAPPQPTDTNGDKIPPWRVPENWFSNRPPHAGGGGYGGGRGGFQGGSGGGYRGGGGGGGGYGQHHQQQQHHHQQQQGYGGAGGYGGGQQAGGYEQYYAQQQQGAPVGGDGGGGGGGGYGGYNAPGYGQQQSATGAADPYAAYYASLAQQPPQA